MIFLDYFGGTYTPPDPSDIGGIDANTVLMLHMDGTDESTTFADDSDSEHTVTANGDAQIDTAEKKFGTGAGLFDGTGDYLSVTDSAEFDFALSSSPGTIDFWIRPTSVSGTQAILSRGSGGPNDWNMTDGNMYLFQLQGSTPAFYFNNNGSAVQVTGPSVSSGAWSHICIDYDGTNFYVGANGSFGSGVSGQCYKPTGVDTMEIGRNSSGGGDPYSGHVDELRFSDVSRIDDSSDPLYIAGGDRSDGFTPPAYAYTDKR